MTGRQSAVSEISVWMAKSSVVKFRTSRQSSGGVKYFCNEASTVRTKVDSTCYGYRRHGIKSLRVSFWISGRMWKNVERRPLGWSGLRNTRTCVANQVFTYCEWMSGSNTSRSHLERRWTLMMAYYQVSVRATSECSCCSRYDDATKDGKRNSPTALTRTFCVTRTCRDSANATVRFSLWSCFEFQTFTTVFFSWRTVVTAYCWNYIPAVHGLDKY